MHLTTLLLMLQYFPTSICVLSFVATVSPPPRFFLKRLKAFALGGRAAGEARAIDCEDLFSNAPPPPLPPLLSRNARIEEKRGGGRGGGGGNECSGRSGQRNERAVNETCSKMSGRWGRECKYRYNPPRCDSPHPQNLLHPAVPLPLSPVLVPPPPPVLRPGPVD